MNYRHAFHAGNFADVVKHVALAAVLLHLRKKEKPFRVIDTHAGAGLYDLAGDAALRTGEAGGGIARLKDLAGEGLPPALSTFLELVRTTGEGLYPGSPLIVARLLRENDKLIAIERHEEEAVKLASALAPFRNARAVCADGYVRLTALLPPPQRRGLVLIDPPYEAEDEFQRLTGALAAARRRFATGIYLAWYPIKSWSASEALSGEVLAGGAEDVLRITVDVGRAASKDGKDRLTAAGLLVVNPPYGMAEEMRAASNILAPRLGPAEILVTALNG